MSSRITETEGEARYREIKVVTWVAVFVNVILAISKIFLGTIGQSQALIADGVHSLADLVSDIIVLFAAKHGGREADEDHPYGHGRIETVIEVALGIFLVIIAIGIAYDAVMRLTQPERLMNPTWYALIAAMISIFCKEGLFRYTLVVARRVKSKLLVANAWHHRSDAISSIIALIGIAGSMMGWWFLDAVAAIGVSWLIAKVGWSISWRSLKELIDTALDAKVVEKIEKIILSVDGVKAVHSLRTRSMGANAFVDVHILVNNPRISVSEGHLISEKVMWRLKNEVDEVFDVMVHIDPEDDEENAPARHLPLRNKILQDLEKIYAENPFFALQQGVTLHYLEGKVDVELVLPIKLLSSTQQGRAEIESSLQKDKNKLAYVNQLTVKFA